MGKPAHLEEDVEGRVQLPIRGETTPLTPESPAYLSGNPSTSGAGLGSEARVHLLHERTVKGALCLRTRWIDLHTVLEIFLDQQLWES